MQGEAAINQRKLTRSTKYCACRLSIAHAELSSANCATIPLKKSPPPHLHFFSIISYDLALRFIFKLVLHVGQFISTILSPSARSRALCASSSCDKTHKEASRWFVSEGGQGDSAKILSLIALLVYLTALLRTHSAILLPHRSCHRNQLRQVALRARPFRHPLGFILMESRVESSITKLPVPLRRAAGMWSGWPGGSLHRRRTVRGLALILRAASVVDIRAIIYPFLHPFQLFLCSSRSIWPSLRYARHVVEPPLKTSSATSVSSNNSECSRTNRARLLPSYFVSSGLISAYRMAWILVANGPAIGDAIRAGTPRSIRLRTPASRHPGFLRPRPRLPLTFPRMAIEIFAATSGVCRWSYLRGIGLGGAVLVERYGVYRPSIHDGNCGATIGRPIGGLICHVAGDLLAVHVGLNRAHAAICLRCHKTRPHLLLRCLSDVVARFVVHQICHLRFLLRVLSRAPRVMLIMYTRSTLLSSTIFNFFKLFFASSFLRIYQGTQGEELHQLCRVLRPSAHKSEQCVLVRPEGAIFGSKQIALNYVVNRNHYLSSYYGQ